MRSVFNPMRLMLAVLLGWACAAPAAAATIGINGSVLTAVADDSDEILFLLGSPSELTFAGMAFDVVTPGCDLSATCSLAGVTEVRIDMRAGDDVVELSFVPALPGLQFIVLGGAGDDILVGGDNGERMYGGAGDDVLIGGAGLNCLSGGGGDNVVIGSSCDAGPDPSFPPAQALAVPEPGSLPLLAAALLALAWRSGRPTRRRLTPCPAAACRTASRRG